MLQRQGYQIQRGNERDTGIGQGVGRKAGPDPAGCDDAGYGWL